MPAGDVFDTGASFAALPQRPAVRIDFEQRLELTGRAVVSPASYVSIQSLVPDFGLNVGKWVNEILGAVCRAATGLIFEGAR